MVSGGAAPTRPTGAADVTAGPAVANRADTPRADEAAALPPAVTAYVAAVVLGGAALATWACLGGAGGALPRLTPVLVWTLAALVSQLLTFQTLTGSGQVSLSTCAHLCMAVLLAPAEFVPALVLGRLLAQLFQRKPWYRALFNAAQVMLAVLAAWAVYRGLGGPPRLEASFAGLLGAMPAFLAAAAAYYLVNMLTVSVVLALNGGTTPLAAWRSNFGYAAELMGTIALVLLTPIAMLSYVSLGGPGLALFLLPLMFIRDASHRYVELRRTQHASLAVERSTAQGELAAEVGHAMSACLTVVEGQLQLLLLKGERMAGEELHQRLGCAVEDVARIQVLSRELIDFNRRQHAPRPTALRTLIKDTVAALVHHRRFEGVRFELDLDLRVRQVRIDPDHVKQVLTSLACNAADALRDARAPRRLITIRLRLEDVRETLELEVLDTGPGIPDAIKPRVFDPGFTTRSDGHGFGLTMVRNIVRNYGGSVRAEDAEGAGARLRVSLPCAGVGLRARAA